MQHLLDKINEHPRATLLVAGSSILGLATVVILVMIVSLHNTVVSPVVTPEEETQVLSEVIKNNPKDLINNNKAPTNNSNPIPIYNQIPVENAQAGSNTPSPTQPQTQPQPEPPVAPNLDEYNFRKTTVTYEKGVAYDSCQPYYHGGGGYPYGTLDSDGVTTSEYTEYFERYYTSVKSQIKDNDNLFSFVINKYGRDVNSSIYYLEGNYAVENKYKPYSSYDNQVDSQVVSYPEGTTEEIISYYFGNNASITDVEVDTNGIKYYTIQSSYSSFCDPTYNAYLVSSRPVPPQRTLITTYRVNGNTFAIEQTKRYVDQISDLSLLDISITSNLRAKVTAQQVASQFQIPANVPVQEYDYSSLNYVHDDVKDLKDKIEYLAEQGSELLLPSDSNGLNYMYAYDFLPENNIDTQAFYKDRLFYPQTTWGDVLFEKYNEQYTGAEGLEYSISFRLSDYNYYSLTAYKNTTLDEQLEISLSDNVTSLNVEDVSLMVTDTLVPAKKVTKVMVYSYPTSYGVSYPVSYGAETHTTYYVTYLFEVGNRIYSINYYNFDNQIDFDTSEFSLWSLGDVEAIDNAKNRVLELYNIYLMSLYPTSYPVSYSN